MVFVLTALVVFACVLVFWLLLCGFGFVDSDGLFGVCSGGAIFGCCFCEVG